MSAIRSYVRIKARIKPTLVLSMALLLLGAFATSGVAAAEEAELAEFWRALIGGKPTLDVRGRIEIAEGGPGTPVAGATTMKQSEAYTIRTRLGYGTKAYHGLTAYVDMENIAGAGLDNYWDKASLNPNGLTVIADPVVTELNQAWLKFEREDWLGVKVIGGRQRIILDDARFIGNVGWRQNEQTYDSALGSASFGVDDLNLTYSYIGYVRRIFGNQSAPAAGTLDWRSNTHLINASYAGVKQVKATAFIYLVELSNTSTAATPKDKNTARAESSATYGVRFTGAPKLGDSMSIAYQASYAYQMDYGNHQNQLPAATTGYSAHYFLGDIKLNVDKIGSIGAGFEMLGSDGASQFRTPLATGHKFNGWADIFLDNGGINGLRDIYANVSPKLPWKLKSSLVYHHFRRDNGGGAIGHEIDAILKRPVNKYFLVLAKGAYFTPSSGFARMAAATPTGLEADRKDIWRVWMEFDFKF